MAIGFFGTAVAVALTVGAGAFASNHTGAAVIDVGPASVNASTPSEPWPVDAWEGLYFARDYAAAAPAPVALPMVKLPLELPRGAGRVAWASHRQGGVREPRPIRNRVERKDDNRSV